jgi:tetratricopeptide (TPR) repeat protein
MPFGEAFLLAFKMVICCVISFAGAYWILAAWFDRRVSGREAILLLLGLVALMFFAISLVFKGGPGILVLAAVVFGGAALLRLLSRHAEGKLVARLNEDEIAKYQQAIEDYPENPYAHSLLADVYRRLGRRELAMAEYEAALNIDPSLRQERYWLERMRTELEQAATKEMTCPRCGTPRRGREIACAECGRPYSSLETWSHAFKLMEPSRKALWLGAGLGAVIAAAATAVLAPGVIKAASLAMLLLAPLAVIVMSRRIRQRTG